MFLVIGVSGKASHGKDSVTNFMSQYFEKRGVLVKRVCFADKLKKVVGDLFDLDDYYLQDPKGKQEILDRFDGITGREILQKFGTDVVRSIYSDIWLYNYMKEIRRLKDEFDPGHWVVVFTPDMRFKNEYNLIRGLSKVYIDSLAIRVARPGFYIEQNNHLSETDLDNIDEWDYEFSTSSLDELRRLSMNCAEMIYVKECKK